MYSYDCSFAVVWDAFDAVLSACACGRDGKFAVIRHSSSSEETCEVQEANNRPLRAMLTLFTSFQSSMGQMRDAAVRHKSSFMMLQEPSTKVYMSYMVLNDK